MSPILTPQENYKEAMERDRMIKSCESTKITLEVITIYFFLLFKLLVKKLRKRVLSN